MRRICLFEDCAAADLEPLTLTRPVFDLWCGLSTLADKQQAAFAPCETGMLVRPHLEAVVREQSPGRRVNDGDWLAAGPVLLVNGRWIPPARFDAASLRIAEPCIGMVDGTIAFAVVGPECFGLLTPENLEHHLAEWRDTLPRRMVDGRMVARPWDLVEWNAEQIIVDYLRYAEQSALHSARPRAGRAGHRRTRQPSRPRRLTQIKEKAPTQVLPQVHLMGAPEQLHISPAATIEPCVVADARRGPVVVAADAMVTAFTRLEGPCYVGPGAQVFAAKIRGGTTLGPQCRIGGEVEASIVQGFSNKYHDGFLGHSYVGAWVNIGAGAHTSDLRHDYGEVIVSCAGLRVPTGSSKVGSFIGDHAKVGLGCLLNSGTTIGAFAGVLPAGKLLPKDVPSFCAVLHGQIAENENIDVLLATADEVMRRRGMRLTAACRHLYRSIYELTSPQRKQALHAVESRRLRRSA